MTSTRLLSATFAAVAMLSACGGGGSDAGAPAPAPVAALAITEDNQTVVARAAVDGGFALTRSQTLEADGRAAAQSAPAGSTANAAGSLSTRRAILSVTRRALALAVSPQQRRNRLDAKASPLAVETATEDCGLGGSFTVSFDDRDNDLDASANDTMTIAFDDCTDAADEVISGSLVFTMSSVVSFTDSHIEFSGTLAFQQVTVTVGEATTSINGAVSVVFLETSSLANMLLTVGTGGLAVSTDAPQYVDAITFESGLRIDTTDSFDVPASSTVSIDGPFSATSIDGLITIDTLQPLVQLNSDTYANSGQIRVDGANDSKLRITVLSNTEVQIELDANGDGSYESEEVVPWSDLVSGD